MKNGHSSLVKALLNPDFYDPPVAKVALIETHISWVFLAGDFAYKLKKPVDFGFLDFSTREKRRHYCQEELRLNRRFAPQLYLEVIPLGGSPEAPHFDQKGALDWVVKMKRFDSAQQFDRLQACGQLRGAQIEHFATHLAQFHRRAAVATKEQPFGSSDAICHPIQQNFSQLRPRLPAAQHPQLAALERWSLAACTRLAPSLEQRKTQGYIRECHGDVHLGNIAWHAGQPLLFDCIEFNENLRWIDPINEIAFLVMDLEDRGEDQLSWRFLNRYLEKSGDYAGVALLDFYKVYRALVRAKVACLRLAQTEPGGAEQAEAPGLARSYLDLATRYCAKRRPRLIISHGLSGSGKTTFITDLAPGCAALRLHSDSERKRLHGLELQAQSGSAVAADLYQASATEKTYLRLQQLAEILLQSGNSVIVDATFLQRHHREQMQQLAVQQEVPFQILDFDLPTEELRRRVTQRQQQTGQISEATCAVLEYQLMHQDPLAEHEKRLSLQITPDMSAASVCTMMVGAETAQFLATP